MEKKEINKIRDINLLYLESNEYDNLTIYNMLKKMFGTVYTGTNMENGLKLLKKYPNIDIILLDIDFNGENIIDLILFLKNTNEKLKILISYTNENEMFYKVKDLNIDGMIKKEFSMSLLFKSIYEIYVNLKSNEIISYKVKENKSLIEILNTIAITLELDNEFNIIEYNYKYKNIANLNKDFLENLTEYSRDNILQNLDNKKVFISDITYKNNNLNLQKNIDTKTFIIPTKENGYLKYIIISFESRFFLELNHSESLLLELKEKDKEIEYLKKQLNKEKTIN